MASLSSMAKSDTLAMAIMQGIQKEIQTKTDVIMKKHEEQIIKELADVSHEVVAKAAIQIAKHSSIQYMQDRIIVEILDRRAEQ